MPSATSRIRSTSQSVFSSSRLNREPRAEPLVFYKYWYDQVGKRKENPGECFVAITDPGTLMEQMATEDKFKQIFLNPPDIGGRYSRYPILAWCRPL